MGLRGYAIPWFTTPVMKIWLAVLLLTIAQFGAGCATFRPTPYQPSTEGGYGYSDEQIGPGEYRITVSGNAATSAEMLWHQLLFRAAEITLKNGNDYFAVVPLETGKLVDIEPAFLMPQFGLGSAALSGIRTPLIQYEGYPVGVVPSQQLIATATIAIREHRQTVTEDVFDAEEVKEGLAHKIVLP
jgi:hypothetical protein